MHHQSEIAQLRARIDAELFAHRQALIGLAEGTADHDRINRKTELFARLIPLFGEDCAMQLANEVYDLPIAAPQSEKKKMEEETPSPPRLVAGIPVESIAIEYFKDSHLPRIRDILAQHGCQLDELSNPCILHLPSGTQKTEIFPRVTFVRFKLILPDGYELYETVNHIEQVSWIGFDSEHFL